MSIVILGFKSFGNSAEPHVIYAGTNGDVAARKIAESTGFVRIGKLVNAPMIPVQVPAVAPVQANVSVEPETNSEKPTRKKL